MNQTKKWALVMLGLLVSVAMVVSGCSGNKEGTASSTPPTESDKTATSAPVTLTVRVGSWWEEKAPQIIEAYKQERPNVTLQIETLPINGYLDKALADVLGGNSPDVLDLDLWMLPALAGHDMLETWDDHIEGLDIDDFLPAVWDSSKIDGKLYGVPTRAESNVFYYNKTMFDEANVAYPSEDWTWEDMLEMAGKITVPGEKYGLGIAVSLSDEANVTASFAPILWSFGGDFLNQDNTEAAINSPEAVKAITFFAELYTKEKVVPEGSLNFALTKDVQPMFLNNQVAMFPTGSNILTTLKENPQVQWGMVYGPNKSGKGTGWSFTIPTSAKHKEEAREFVLWYMKPENMGKFNPRSPARKSAYNMPPWDTEEVQYILSAAPYQRMTPPVAAWPEMQTVVVTELQKVLSGIKTPQEGADDMAKQMNELLKK